MKTSTLKVNPLLADVDAQDIRTETDPKYFGPDAGAYDPTDGSFDPANIENEDRLPDGFKVEEQLRDNGSSRMLEEDSFGCFVDGLKRSGESARMIYQVTKWPEFLRLADAFDRIRKEGCEIYGGATARQSNQTQPQPIGDGFTRLAAYIQIKEGLEHASTAARQIGNYHRGKEVWVEMGWGLMALKDKCNDLIGKRAGGLGLVI